MKYYIFENQVVGDAADPDNVPAGWAIAEGEDGLSPENAFFDGEQVREKPPKPAPEAFWDLTTNQWQVLTPQILPPANDWAGLQAAFRGTHVFNKIFIAGGETLAASQGYSLLMDTIASSKNIEDLIFAISYLRQAMAGTQGGDFTADELEWIRARFEENGFDPEEFNLN